jgi:hypothetical protein
MGRIFNRTSATTGEKPNRESMEEVRTEEFQGKLNVFIGQLYIGDAVDRAEAERKTEAWIEKYPTEKYPRRVK